MASPVTEPDWSATPVGTRADRPPIDWGLAVRTAGRLLPPGPVVPRAEADHVVRRLRALAITAEGHVRTITGLDDGRPPRPAQVVDRPGWAAVAADGMRALVEGATTEPAPRSAPVRLGRAVLGRTAGLQLGAVLGVLGTRILGQYDPFGGSAAAPGRLVLVAPNIVAVGAALDVPAEDFRMWVCLHEATHRLQFSAVPWLRDYFAGLVSEFVAASDDDALSGMLGRLPDALRAARAGDQGPGLLALVQTPRQRAALDSLLALATLLEGHADHVMDAVGPSVVPSVDLLRRRFTARRTGGGLSERVLRAVLGLDAKLRQYAEGAAFTRHVVGAVGMDGFNAVWTSPHTLPTRAELAEPDRWVRRVPAG